MNKLKDTEKEIYSIISELNSINRTLIENLSGNNWDQDIQALLEERENLSYRLDQFSNQPVDSFGEKTNQSIHELLKLNQELAVHLERKIENFKGLIARRNLLGS